MTTAKKKPTVVTGQVAHFVSRETFRERFTAKFFDPAFDPLRAEIDQLEAVAWDGYQEGRKSPVTKKAGRGFADPGYDLSVEWRETSDRLKAIEKQRKASRGKPNVLVICGSPRNDGSCPGEMSKTFRLSTIIADTLRANACGVELLDLSLLTNEYDKRIHPCKGCVSTAMPLCHWPCSCYPNHATGQVNDAMADIYERWVAADGIVIVTPTHWYQSPSVLKLMIDRLVCADGGNPDPTSTHGKKAAEAKAIELKGWDFPKHVAGRVYGVMVHGDVAGIEGTRRALSDWLDWMGLIEAGSAARLDRYIGYYKPYATSHQELDRDKDVQEEARDVGRAVAMTLAAVRAGKHEMADPKLDPPRVK